MIELKDTVEPTDLKLRTYVELKEHCDKNNIFLTKMLLLKYGFNFPEIKWLQENNEGEIKLINDLIEETLKNKIKNLTIQLEDCNKTTSEKPYKVVTLFDDMYEIKTVRNNNDNIVVTRKEQCPKKHVDLLKKIILGKTSNRYNLITYREIVKLLIKEHDLHVGIDAFNGGKNRASYYFPLYMRPLKILENGEMIKIKGQGIIEVLHK